MIGVAGLLAGCGDDPATAPAPTPTYSCTPDPTGAPCTAELAAAQAEEAKAYEEAIFVYQEFTKERNRLLLSGGAESPSPLLEKYATGQYLDDVISDLSLAWRLGIHGSSGIKVQKIEHVSFVSDSVILRSCEDGSAIHLLDRSGEVVGQGSRVSVELGVERHDGDWRIVSGKSGEPGICAV